MKNWQLHTIRISPKGEVTLRTPASRAIGWHHASDGADAAAAEWQKTFRGAVIDDRRAPHQPIDR